MPSLTQSDIPRPPSFERRRPRTGQAHAHTAQPQFPPHESSGTGRGRRRPPGPQSPPMEDYYEYRRDARPPFAPEVPHSPSTSTSNTLSSSQSSNTPSLPNHWLTSVFEQSLPTTPLEITGQSLVALPSQHQVSTDQDPGPYLLARIWAQRLAEGLQKDM